MIISYLLLQKYLPEISEFTPKEIGEKLTSLGLEVGAIEEIESVKGGLKGYVIGKVQTCTMHPNSDHLHITTVDVGELEPLPIVCGAPNVSEGQTVVVATVGAIVYGDNESFTIKKSKLRGEPSHGMICSQKELGVGNDSSGIMVLSEEVKPGTLAAEYFNVTKDYAIEVDITPNRVDATSHFGVARDLAALLSFHSIENKNLRAQKPSIQLPPAQKGTFIKVSVEVSKELCPRYQGLTIEGITNGESPSWLQSYLNTIGLRPINKVVDVTNFVLHELGQPLHAFDSDAIKGNTLRITTLPQGTSFTTLDGIKRELNGQEIMICDEALTPLCMAGVMGGETSGVQERTTKIFLECANFNSSAIRKTARAHAISSDSSFRFERGLCPCATQESLHRAASLIIELCGGHIVGQEVDHYRLPLDAYKVTLRYEKIYKTIGVTIEKEIIQDILRSLDMEILQSSTDEELHLSVPAYRVDVTRDVDVIEEILRIYGYNSVPLTGYIKANLSTRSRQDELYRSELILSEQLVGAGFMEILNNSQTSSKYYANYTEQFPESSLVQLENPLSSDLDIMRPSLLMGGLESISRNINRKRTSCSFFEWGKSYLRNNTESVDPTLLFQESEQLALWVTGELFGNSWAAKAAKQDEFRLKGIVENLFRRMSIDIDSLQTELGEDQTFDHKLTYYIGKEKKILAELGSVRTEILNSMEIPSSVFYAYINKKELMEDNFHKKIESVELSKYPIVKRDLAYLIDESVTYEEIRATALKAEQKLLKKVELFDVYTGKNLPNSKKSYALSFYLGDDNATLKERQIEATMARIRKAIEETHNAQIR